MSDVLVPLDGSATGEAALPLAARIARATGGGLRLLQAVPPPGMTYDAAISYEPLIESAQVYLSEVASRVGAASGIAVRIQAELGFPTATILRVSDDPEVSDLVMSTHGRSGLLRFVMGSVAEQVLRESPIPVFLMPPKAEIDQHAPIARLLVPLDGSDFAYSVMGPVIDLARRTGAEVLLLRVPPGPQALVTDEGRQVVTADEEAAIVTTEAARYLDPIVDHLRSEGLPARRLIETGDPAEEIVRLAAAERADLIALATHGRSGLDRLTHGSVAESVLRTSQVPIMTFGRTAIRRLWEDVSRLSG